jgi:hypothetical protein
MGNRFQERQNQRGGVMKIYVKYSKLDKRWIYQIENDYSFWSQWVWFYLGKYLLFIDKKYSVYPYNVEGSTKLCEYKDKGNSAEITAKRIAKRIDGHYFNHEIKKKGDPR